MSVKRVSQNSFKNRTIAYIENGGGISTLINSVVYTDSNYNTLTANAAATTFGTFRILGTNLEPGANVMLANTAAGTFSNVTSNTTYVGSNEIRANVSVTAGNYSLYIFNPDGSAAIYYSGVTFEPYPQWTTTSYSSSAILNVQLLTSSTAVEQPITYALVSGTLPTGASLSANGLISGTVTQANSTQSYTFTVSATDIYNETTQSPITLTISLADQYFNQTTLLLNGETATNTYIKDSSNNNFALTPYGSATSNRFSPLWGNGYYGNYFDGSSGYFTVPNASAITLNTGSVPTFTIEAWIYPSNQSGNNFIIDKGSVSAQNIMNYRLMSSSGITFFWGSGSGGTDYTAYGTSGITINVNTWYHVAVVSNAGALNIYVNGVSYATGTLTSYSDNGYPLYIGSFSGGSQFYQGYISNLRIVKGTALYTSNFTPSTTPLTAVANTGLLTCQSNAFLDNSNNMFTLTRNGTVKVVPNQPFGAVPSTATVTTNSAGYYSAQFDGSTGYISLPSTSALTLGSSGNFTIELWFYPLTSEISGTYLFCKDGIASTNYPEYSFRYYGNGTLIFSTGNATGAVSNQNYTTITPTVNAWNHVAACRVGTTWYIFLNGVLANSGGTAQTVTPVATGAGVTIGNQISGGSGTGLFTGYISNLRIINGTALYTTSFTPSTIPLTAIANTALLTLQNSMIVDNSTNAFTLTPTGNVKVSQNQPFASPTVTSNIITPSVYGSGLFDGSTGYITSPTSNTLGSGSWTVEAWVYFTNPSSSYDGILCTGATGTEQVYMSKADAGSTDGISQGASINYTASYYQWLHYALVCNGTTMFMYINGVLVGSTARTYVPYGTTPVIGRRYADSSSYEMNGYISNVRITPGIAVYTNNFLPSNQPLTPVANTTLLTLQNKNSANNNSFYDDSVNNFALTRTGTPTQGTFTPFSQTGWSNYFDGSTGYLSIPNNSLFNFGSNNFTIEAWVYINAYTSGSQTIFGMSDSAGDLGSGIYFYAANTSGYPSFSAPYGGTNNFVTSSISINLRTWNHIVMVRNGANINLYVNGIQTGTISFSSLALSNSTNPVGIGRNGAGNFEYLNGYISNLRVVSGTAVYTSNFTPSTTPLTAISGTALLTCQSNRFLDNSTNTFILTPNGAVQVQAFSPFAPGVTYSSTAVGGSVYFASTTGANNYFTTPATSVLEFGSNNFTIELWWYPQSTSRQALYHGSIGADYSIGLDYNSIGTNYTISAWASTNGSSWNMSSGDAGNTGIGGIVIKQNSWTHIVYTRNNNQLQTYINGVLDINLTVSGSITNRASYGKNIGCWYSTSAFSTATGYISNLRISNNQAVYSANFTPPSGPFIPSTNTALLLSATNTGIQDATGKNNLITVGSSMTQANTVKFGTGAMYFDGTSGYLKAPASPVFNFGTSNFTIEAWVYMTSLPTTVYFLGQTNSSSYAPVLAFISSGKPGIAATSASGSWTVNASISSAISANTWTHIAWVRNGNAWLVFVNGTMNTIAASTSVTTYTATDSMYIGAGNGSSISYYFPGYIDDLRVTNGVARYTSNFTPSSSPDLLQ